MILHKPPVFLILVLVKYFTYYFYSCKFVFFKVWSLEAQTLKNINKKILEKMNIKTYINQK